MNDLLQFAIDAHGGLDRWRRRHTISANLSIGGHLWEKKSRAGLLARTVLTASMHEQRAEILLPDDCKEFVFTAQRVTVRSHDGHTLASSDHPREAFAGHTQETAWDDIHIGYFNGYALWQYLTAPFVYASPGFAVEEEEPWNEDGETWRVLRVRFPDHIAAHTRVQRAYYGPDGLLRRHQYSVDVLGGAQGLNYASDFRDCNGILVPAQRRVYAQNAEGKKIAEPVLVSIDIQQLHFE